LIKVETKFKILESLSQFFKKERILLDLLALAYDIFDIEYSIYAFTFN
tara:strand:- start:2041 stop:2184 length:144 start_codon:yes stop_codon:yes gene_type:complete